jgi:hypothetical protein
MEGVTEAVYTAMATVGANVLAEDGLLLRTCEHGIRHPVGYVDPHRMFDPAIERHETRDSFRSAVCCGCCVAWFTPRPELGDEPHADPAVRDESSAAAVTDV